MADFQEIEFSEGEYTHVELLQGSLPALDPVALDFQAHGVRVEQHEPNPGGGHVRHVTFVPYSNIKKIYQGYLVGGGS